MEGQRYRPDEENFVPNEGKEGDNYSQKREVREDDLTFAGVKENPDARQKHIERLAVRGAPLEVMLARRQEVKDDAARSMTSVGEVVAEKMSQDTPVASQEGSDRTEQPKPLEVPEIVDHQSSSPAPKPLPSLYRVAILWGFVMAILIILIVILFSWL